MSDGDLSDLAHRHRGSGQHGDRRFSLVQPCEVGASFPDEALPIAYQRRLIVDHPDFHPSVDESPEAVRQAQLVLDDEMTEVVRQTVAVAWEFPARRCAVVASDVYAIAAAAPPDKRDLEHTAMMTKARALMPPETRTPEQVQVEVTAVVPVWVVRGPQP